MNKRLKTHVITGCLFIMAGLLVGYQPLVRAFADISSNNSKSLQAPLPTKSPAKTGNTIVGEPLSIRVPTADINVTVLPGYFDPARESWTLGDDSAYWATTSPQPNNSTGTTYVYGHSTKEVFGNLLNLKLGDTATVLTKNKKTFTYRYTYEKVTSPDDVTVFSNTGAPRLILQTCSGVWYQNRSLLVFELVEVS